MSFEFYEETMLCVLAALGIVAIFREILIYRVMRNFGEKLTLLIHVCEGDSPASITAVRRAMLYCLPCLEVKTIEGRAVTEENGEGACQN